MTTHTLADTIRTIPTGGGGSLTGHKLIVNVTEGSGPGSTSPTECAIYVQYADGTSEVKHLGENERGNTYVFENVVWWSACSSLNGCFYSQGTGYDTTHYTTGPDSNAYYNASHLLTQDTTIVIGTGCFAAGTLISLADGSEKPIESITYEDDLLVWDFDNGKLASAKPAWLLNGYPAAFAWRSVFEDGTELVTLGSRGHRVFCEDGVFRYNTEAVGYRCRTRNGWVRMKSVEIIDGQTLKYNVITKRHFCVFANGLLTSCRFGNMLYPIEDMRYVKSAREVRPIDEFSGVGKELYNAFRVGELQGDTDEIASYVKRL